MTEKDWTPNHPCRRCGCTGFIGWKWNRKPCPNCKGKGRVWGPRNARKKEIPHDRD